MKLSAIVPLLLAIAVGVVTVYFGRDLLQKKDAAASAAPVETQKVLVAAADLPLGQELAAEHLKYLDFPPELVPPGRIPTTEAAVGRVLAAPVGKGQMMVETLLAPDGTAAGLQAAIPKGMRAVTIEVNEVTGLAGLITQGCRVDVVTTLTDERTRQPVSRAIVQNVPVQAVGGNMNPKSDGKDPTGRVLAKSITLIVTPEQAEALDLAYTKSKPRLVLRSADEESGEASQGVTLTQLVSGRVFDEQAVARTVEQMMEKLMAKMPPPATQPLADSGSEPEAARWSVEVIRGGVQSVQEFEDPAAADGKTGTATRPPAKARSQTDPFSSAAE